jgi:HSP20 family protein
MRDVMIPRKNYTINDYFYKFDKPAIGDGNCMKADIIEQDDKYYIVMDVPGINKDSIVIDYENGYLNVKAVKPENNSISYIRRERFVGEVRRSFYIGSKRESDIKAVCRDGVLEIAFPKQELPRKNSKSIAVE